MILSKFIEGLQVLQPYYDKDGFDIGAEHDIAYIYKTDRPLSVADVAKMVELGWHQPDAQVGDGDFEVKHYDPEDGWGAYV